MRGLGRGGPARRADHVDDHRADRQPGLAQLGDAVDGLLHRHLLQHGDQVHRGLRATAARRITPVAWLWIGPIRASPATSVLTFRNRAIRPVGGASMHHGVVQPAAVRPLAGDRLHDLAGQQHVAHAGGDRGREVDRADLAAAPARPGAGCRTSRGTPAAPARGRSPARTPRRRRGRDARPGAPRRAAAAMSKSCAMPWRPSTSISSMRRPGGQRERQRGGHRRLAGAALAGDHVQPHALPVGPSARLLASATLGVAESTWPGAASSVASVTSAQAAAGASGRRGDSARFVSHLTSARVPGTV